MSTGTELDARTAKSRTAPPPSARPMRGGRLAGSEVSTGPGAGAGGTLEQAASMQTSIGSATESQRRANALKKAW